MSDLNSLFSLLKGRLFPSQKTSVFLIPMTSSGSGLNSLVAARDKKELQMPVAQLTPKKTG